MKYGIIQNRGDALGVLALRVVLVVYAVAALVQGVNGIVA